MLGLNTSLSRACKTGTEVRDLAQSGWGLKFKAALNIDEPETKALYDELNVIRKKLRNHVAHGAFGNDGQAFSFHSNAGAVPLLLPHRRDRESFRFGSGAELDPTQAFDVIARFVSHLWMGRRAGMKLYIQEYQLPAILTMSADGTHERTTANEHDMVEFTEDLVTQIDIAKNMDW